jgi:3-oxoacyl-[acyl-carrier protein] reductase
MQKLKDKVAIITGGAKGIGKATTRLFVSEGCSVAIWDIDEEAGRNLASQLRTEGADVRYYQVNTTDLDAVNLAVGEVAEAFGGIDILINNAGITRDASLKKMTPQQWQQVIDVNLTGVFNCTKAVFPLMSERGGGRILNASSVVGLYGNFGQTNYVASKAGVIGMTKVWAREFGSKGITVNAVAPGFIRTEMIETIPEEVKNAILQKCPLGRMGEVDDIAKAYLFLASDDASFITGTVLSVDGGLVA